MGAMMCINADWRKQAPICKIAPLTTSPWPCLAPSRVRFRILEPNVQAIPGAGKRRHHARRAQFFWGSEDAPVHIDLFRLTAQERDLYDDLRYNHLQRRLRLEQEHIRYGWLQECRAHWLSKRARTSSPAELFVLTK